MMKSAIKYLFSLAGIWPYRFILKALEGVVKITRMPVNIWPRNSYVSGALEPGFSDIDLTLFFAETASKEAMTTVFYSARILRTAFPLIGEVNMYRGIPKSDFLTQHNYFELNRDPILLKQSNFDKTPDVTEAAVFLFRQLEKDIHQISSIPNKRLKKWKNHFDSIDSKFPELNLNQNFSLNERQLLPSIVAVIVHCLGIFNPVTQSDLQDKFYLYFECVRSKVNFSQMRSLLVTDAWWMVLAPVQLSTIAFAPQMLSEVQLKFLVRQLRWEICGCLTQAHDKNQNQTRTHLKILQAYYYNIKRVQTSDELNEIENLFKTAFNYLDFAKA